AIQISIAAAAAIVLTSVLASVAVVIARHASDDTTSAAPAIASGAPGLASAEALSPAASASTGEPSPANESRSLALRANAPLTEVNVEGRAVEITPPATQATVSLDADEATKDLHVTATSADGRRASIRIARGATTGAFVFVTPRTSSPPPRAPAVVT